MSGSWTLWGQNLGQTLGPDSGAHRQVRQSTAEFEHRLMTKPSPLIADKRLLPARQSPPQILAPECPFPGCPQWTLRRPDLEFS
jgi:hypothetical protein